jgi:hypothetical protein
VKRALVLAACAVPLGGVATQSGSSSPGATVRVRLAGPPATIVEYGYVRSLARKGSSYRMRFDPALWLSGETANRAAEADGVIAPGEGVPNDYYVRNESRKQLTYTVPHSARVTVVTHSDGAGVRSTRIPVSELAAIVKGRNPKGRNLYAGNTFGYWVRVAGDRAVALDQQYQP